MACCLRVLGFGVHIAAAKPGRREGADALQWCFLTAAAANVVVSARQTCCASVRSMMGAMAFGALTDDKCWSTISCQPCR